jgi:hypothetical protein
MARDKSDSPGRGRRAWRSASNLVAKRPVQLSAVALTSTAAAVAATFGLHSLLHGSSDAWAAAISAVSTAVLVAITAVYVYLTYGLLRAQLAGPRAAAWEASLRDLRRFLGVHHRDIFRPTQAYPVDTSTWPDVDEAVKRHSALTAVGYDLVDFVGLVPAAFAGKVLVLSKEIAAASKESSALVIALLTERANAETETRSPTWDGVRQAYNPADAVGESWEDIAAGKHCLAAMDQWNQLTSDLNAQLSG